MEHLSGGPLWAIVPGKTHKHKTRMERLAKDKHSSLLQKFVTYGRKKFDRIGPWSRSHKTFQMTFF